MSDNYDSFSMLLLFDSDRKSSCL